MHMSCDLGAYTSYTILLILIIIYNNYVGKH